MKSSTKQFDVIFPSADSYVRIDEVIAWRDAGQSGERSETCSESRNRRCLIWPGRHAGVGIAGSATHIHVLAQVQQIQSRGISGFPAQHDPATICLFIIDARRVAVEGGDAAHGFLQSWLVDPTATVGRPTNQSQRQYVLHDRNVDAAAEFVVVTAFFGRGIAHIHEPIQLLGIGFTRYEANVTGHRISAIQCPLGAIEHFHTVHIDVFDWCVFTTAVLGVGRRYDKFIEIGTHHRGSVTVNTANDVFLVAWAEILEIQSRD